jgi:hypothetical protein
MKGRAQITSTLQAFDHEEPQVVGTRSGIVGIDADSSEWFDGYTRGVIEALARKDQARENREIADRRAFVGYPSCTMRLED